MATIDIQAPEMGSGLQSILGATEIQPGTEVGYGICKSLFVYHSLGKKMAESPVAQAMAMPRVISVPDAPEDEAVKRFEEVWEHLNINAKILSVATLARVYGVASVGLLPDKDEKSTTPVNFKKLHAEDIRFNVWDPLNTAGSFAVCQDPNDPLFQRNQKIVVSGQEYNRSRTCVLIHEQPIYLDYESSGFGWTGRSVYQRALYPLRTYLLLQQTNNLVATKCGIIVGKLAQNSSEVDKKTSQLTKFKLNLLKWAGIGDVIGIGLNDSLESLNLQNLDTSLSTVRKHILEDIAVSADMPAVMLNSESYAEGFGEGTEDAKVTVRYLDSLRIWMRPVYAYFDKMVQHIAWSPEWYERLQREYPDQFSGMDFDTAFYRFQSSFSAEWPSLLIEPESEKAKNEQVKIGAVLSIAQLLLSRADPENVARIVQWVQDNANENHLMFPDPLDLDIEALAQYTPPAPPEPQGLKGLSLAGL